VKRERKSGNSLHSSYHRGRTANENFAVSCSRVREVLFNVLLGDKTDTPLPARGWVVEDINDLEFLLVDIHEFLEVIPEKDIFLIDVGVNKGDGGAIERVPEGGTDDLNHGRNTGTTSNHAQMADEVGGIDKVAFGALDANSVANLEEGDVAGNVTFFISL